MEKLPIAILGTGNIGSDLLAKVIKSPYLACRLFAGRNVESSGISRAKKLGINTSTNSLDAITADKESKIVFDATNAESHRINMDKLGKTKKIVIDLTPSKMGCLCVPLLNLSECFDKKDICLITCGGQATIPISKILMEVHPEIKYIEIASSISSKSAGPATRQNIDEYIQTTERGIKSFSGVKNAKAILNINPAEPPINMHNTIYAEFTGRPDLEAITKKVNEAAEKMKKYIPGYKISIPPRYDGEKISLTTEVMGVGDYLPKYAGNLDIMTCAAIAVAEGYAKLIGDKNE